jgi:hypothetical protein
MAELEHGDDPPLDVAYENLLSSREAPLLFGSLDESSVSDEEKMCNMNLNTSILFQTLSEKNGLLTEKVRAVKQDQSDFNYSVTRCINTVEELRKKHVRYANTSSALYTERANAFLETLGTTRCQVEKEIANQIHAAETELEDNSRKLNAVRRLVIAGAKQVMKTEEVNQKMCPVCFDREINTVLVPCGHTYCMPCVENDHSNRCSQCRTQIQRYIKIYFTI